MAVYFKPLDPVAEFSFVTRYHYTDVNTRVTQKTKKWSK